MKRGIPLIVAVVLVLSVTGVASATPAPVVVARTMAAADTNPECLGWWYFKVCFKWRTGPGKLQLGSNVGGSPYVWLTFVGNGCLNANPTKLLANLKFCVANYSRTVTARSKTVGYGKYAYVVRWNVTTYRFSLQVKGCVGYGWFKACKNSKLFWYTLTYP